MMEKYAWLIIVFNALEVFCCIWMFQSFAVRRRAEKRWIMPVSVIVLCCAEWVITNVIYEDFAIKAIALIGILSFAMFLLYQIRYMKALVLTMLFYGIMLVSDYISLVVMGTIFPGRFWDFSNVFLFYGMRIFCIALAFGMIFCIKKMLGSRVTDIFTVKEWYALAAISLITIVSIISITYETDWAAYASRPLTVASFHIHVAAGILCINFIGYYLIHSITEREIKLREHAVFREKVKNETAMYRSVSENLEKQRKRTHEYKNQLAAISALAEQGAYEELRTYIEKIETTLQHRMDAVDTNHVIVNAILNTKYREAVSKGIVVILKVNNLSALKMEEEDIVVILSNLLNNALEACEQCEDKWIKLKFVLEDGQAVISVKNSMAAEPVVEDGALLTTKTKEAAEHGMGIQNVVETVEKCGGRYMVDYGRGEFQFSILIPNHE